MSLALKILAIHDATDRIRAFDLVASDGQALPRCSAGAHLRFDLGTLGSRAYSLIDWPEDTDASGYRIAVQREDAGDGGSQHMHCLAIGSALTAEGPENTFALHDTAGPALLLAGGIGVTPLIAMATALTRAKAAFSFVYAGRSRNQMAFADRIETCFPDAAQLCPDDTRPLDLGALMAGLAADTHVYVCGPRGMIDAARAAALTAGLPETQIHVELFSTPVQEAGDTAFEVELASTGRVFTIPPGQSIIDILETEGVDLIYDCQRGDCGICQTDVISGTPDHRDVVLSAAERASGKHMQICVSRAKSSRLVLDL